MARSTATATVAELPDVDVTEANAEKAATFDWDVLEEPSIVVYDYATPKSAVDWEAETPEPIKARVKASYAAYEAAYVENEKAARQACGIASPGVLPEGTVKRIAEAAGRSAQRVQKCGSQAQAEAFVKFAKNYATSLEWTCRISPIKDGQTEVSYRVKPKEVRTRTA